MSEPVLTRREPTLASRIATTTAVYTVLGVAIATIALIQRRYWQETPDPDIRNKVTLIVTLCGITYINAIRDAINADTDARIASRRLPESILSRNYDESLRIESWQEEYSIIQEKLCIPIDEVIRSGSVGDEHSEIVSDAFERALHLSNLMLARFGKEDISFEAAADQLVELRGDSNDSEQVYKPSTEVFFTLPRLYHRIKGAYSNKRPSDLDLFYTESTPQNDWRMAYNAHCDAMGQIVSHIGNRDERFATWVVPDLNPEGFKILKGQW